MCVCVLQWQQRRYRLRALCRKTTRIWEEVGLCAPVATGKLLLPYTSHIFQLFSWRVMYISSFLLSIYYCKRASGGFIWCVRVIRFYIIILVQNSDATVAVCRVYGAWLHCVWYGNRHTWITKTLGYALKLSLSPRKKSWYLTLALTYFSAGGSWLNPDGQSWMCVCVYMVGSHTNVLKCKQRSEIPVCPTRQRFGDLDFPTDPDVLICVCFYWAEHRKCLEERKIFVCLTQTLVYLQDIISCSFAFKW